MAKKTERMARELPGMERKRTREKAPMTATPVPRLPLTMRMTVVTRTGRMERVMMKFLLLWVVFMWVRATMRPRTKATPRQAAKFSMVIPPLMMLLNMVLIPCLN